HGRGRLGPVLDPGDGARRPGVRRDGPRAPARGRIHPDRRDDLADSRAGERRRLALGFCLPRAGPRARRGGDDPAAFSTLLALLAWLTCVSAFRTCRPPGPTFRLRFRGPG